MLFYLYNRTSLDQEFSDELTGWLLKESLPGVLQLEVVDEVELVDHGVDEEVLRDVVVVSSRHLLMHC